MKDKRLETWIDYLEEESDPTMSADLARVLEHSKDDVQVLKELKNLRGALRRADVLPKQADFDLVLFDKVMKAVAQQPVPERPRSIFSRPQWIGAAAAAIAAVVVAVGLVENSPTPAPQLASEKSVNGVTDWIVEASIKDPAALSEAVNNYQTEADFVVDALSHQLEGMSDDEAQTMIEELLNK